MYGYDQKFAERLNQLIERDNLGRFDLARATGLSSSYIQRLRQGYSLPRVINLIAIADFFHVSLDYLLGRSNDPLRHP